MSELLLKRECKKLAKLLCGYSPKIVFGDMAYCESDNTLISLIANEAEDVTTVTCCNYFKNILDIQLSVFTYTILHELGHFYTIEQGVLDDIDDDVFSSLEVGKICQALYDADIITFEQAYEIYYEHPVEKIANDQIKIWINPYREEIEKFDRVVSKLQKRL